MGGAPGLGVSGREGYTSDTSHVLRAADARRRNEGEDII